MKFMKLSFENEDLERKFQQQILKQSKKGYIIYQLIPIIMVFFVLLDQILKKNIIMIIWHLVTEIVLGSYLIFSFKYPSLLNNISSYYYFVDIGIGAMQYIYSEVEFLSLNANDVKIMQDIILQTFLIYRTRYNYIGGSLTFIFFISVRFYVHVGYGYPISSIAYLFSGTFFMIDQYKQEKFRRKLFIKTQRNKQLELLIEEFIDDQVSIIEKDSENVRFKIIIFNKKILQSAAQFIKFLKEVKLPQKKEQLLDYLYKSKEQKETLLGTNQKYNYSITYQSFTLKKQQMFLKIKLLDNQIDNLIDYKELFMHITKRLQLRPQKLYKGQQIIKRLYMKSFYYQFSRYFQYYKLELDVISYQFLSYVFKLYRIQWIENNNFKPFQSDKKLILLLMIFIKSLMYYDVLQIKFEEQLIKIEITLNKLISQHLLNQINKILFHIGYQLLDEQIQYQANICLILIDKQGLEKFH